jgi:hypothetical protein
LITLRLHCIELKKHFNLLVLFISFIYKQHLILFSIYASTEKEANIVIAFLLEVTSSVSLADICTVSGVTETLHRTFDSAGVLKEILVNK